MRSYVDSVLAEGERIVHRAAISRWKFFKQEEGKTQKAVGDVKEDIKDAVMDVKKDVAPQ